MIRGVYAAAAGMLAMLTRAQLISNNLANVDTPGYREDTLRLSTFPQQLMARLGAGGTRPIGATSMGVVNESVVTSFLQASLRATDNPLDVAIQGPGFFTIQTAQGVRYTRDGSFRRDGNNQLVTAQGDLVLGADGAPIVVPPGLITILPDGQIRRTDDVTGQDAPVGQLGIAEFAEPAQLRKDGSNLFEDPTGLAQAAPAVASTVHQGFLEGSNVDPTRAMADLLIAQRSYEASARMISLQDGMTAKAVSEIGRV